MQRPSWLDKKINVRLNSRLENILKDAGLNTICQEAFCPNISECFSKGVATFLILGNVCTRNCSFCAVGRGDAKKLDPHEPKRVAEAVVKLGLKHVVITSVTRDDLTDGGASVFRDTIIEVRKISRHIKIEVLTPDFNGDPKAIKQITGAAPDIFGHNIETVPGLYKEVRPEADYKRSISVLKTVKMLNSAIYTKSGIMLGLGEDEGEVISILRDLRSVGCDFLSIGQYLSPSKNHYHVKEYIIPEKFDFYKTKAYELGFKYVESSPYTRSSYLAGNYLS